jgi:hypothetical protein
MKATVDQVFYSLTGKNKPHEVVINGYTVVIGNKELAVNDKTIDVSIMNNVTDQALRNIASDTIYRAIDNGGLQVVTEAENRLFKMNNNKHRDTTNRNNLPFSSRLDAIERYKTWYPQYELVQEFLTRFRTIVPRPRRKSKDRVV